MVLKVNLSLLTGTSESDSDCAILGGPCGGDVPAMTAMNTAYLKDSHEDVVRVNLQRDKTGLGLGLIDGMVSSGTKTHIIKKSNIVLKWSGERND